MTQINKQVNKQDNKQVIKPLGKKQLLKTITLNYTDNTRLIQTLYDFIDMRSEMKKSFTENSYKKFLHRLDSLGKSDSEKLEILDTSISGGYTNIFPLKKNSGFSQKDTAVYESGEYDNDYIERLMRAKYN